MTTLEGRHPLIAIRTRGGKPASLLEVLLIAAVTLGAAIAIAFAIHHSGGTGASQQPAVAAKRVPAIQVHTTSLPPGVRYDGGPEEGTRGSLPFADAPSLPPGVRYDGGPEEGTRGPLQVAHASPNPPAISSENGPHRRRAGGR
jgi:hypothetical protein